MPRMMMILLILCVILLIFLAAALLRSGWEQKHFIVCDYALQSPRLRGGFRAAVIADLHGACFGKENADLIRAIEQISPDLILIPGDLITCRRGAEKVKAPDLSLLRILASHYPVFYAPGNHEENYLKLHPEFAREVMETGAVFLMNEIRIAETPCGCPVSVAGLSIGEEFYVRGRQPQMPEDFLKEKLGDCPEGFTILLAHNPEYFADYAKWGCDCVVSGHNHGGVIRLPLIGGVISASLHPFGRFDRGEYKEGKTTMFLSAGLGTHTIHVRLFNRPELLNIRIQK